MKFRTEISPLPLQGTLRHEGAMLMMGSCFTDNIGALLKGAMFDVDINPFGTTFNPLSIAQCLRRIIHSEPMHPDELFEANGMYNSFLHHSSFSRRDPEESLQGMNRRISQASAHLKEAQTLILTWGTAYVFRLQDVDSHPIVNNCHKLPQNKFSRTSLSVDDIVGEYDTLLQEVFALNPNIKVILTISPIRHLADGLSGNSLSKAILRVAAGQIVSQNPSRCIYFPSYEAIVDDLRDYRYYADDLVHTTPLAQQYIYELFLASFCSPETQRTASECVRLTKRLSHRFLTDNTEAQETFLEQSERLKADMLLRYPYLHRVMPQSK